MKCVAYPVSFSEIFKIVMKILSKSGYRMYPSQSVSVFLMTVLSCNHEIRKCDICIYSLVSNGIHINCLTSPGCYLRNLCWVILIKSNEIFSNNIIMAVWKFQINWMNTKKCVFKVFNHIMRFQNVSVYSVVKISSSFYQIICGYMRFLS